MVPTLYSRLDRGLRLHTFLFAFPLSRRGSGFRLTWRTHFCFLHITAWCSLAAYCFNSIHSSLLISGWLMRSWMTLYTCVFISGILVPVIRKEELSRALGNMVQVDQEFITNHNGFARPLWLLSFVVMAAMLRLCFFKKPDNPFIFVFSYSGTVFCILVIDQFAIFLNVIRSQFRTITSELSVAYSTSRFASMDNLCLCHHKLVMAAHSLNRVFSPQILFILAISFFLSTSELFFVFSQFISDLRSKNGVLILVKLCWTILPAKIIFYICSQCHITSDTANEYNILLFQLMAEDKYNAFMFNEKVRLHMFLKHEVVFTACGFFNLDYHLVHSVVASGTTYIVILIQYGQEQPTVPSDNVTSTLANTTTAIANVSSMWENRSKIYHYTTPIGGKLLAIYDANL